MADEIQGSASSGTSILETVKAVWSRRRWLALTVFVLPMTAAIGLTLFLPSLYKSTALVLVERQQVPENMVQATVTSALETRLQTISQEILSRSRLQALIQRFNLYPDLRTRVSEEEVIGRMRSDIALELKTTDPREARKASRASITVAFGLSYRGSHPATVAQVTNTLASFYIEENLKVRERAATGTAQFLKVQLDDLKKRLDVQEAKVSEFKRRHIGALPQQAEANLASVERLNTQLRMNVDTQTRLAERREALVNQLAEAAGSSGGAGPEATAARISQLHGELRKLRAQFSDKYPDVVRLKTEIAALEKELAEGSRDKTAEAARAAALSPHAQRLKQTLATTDGELQAAKAEEKRIRASIATYLARVEQSPQREQEFKELSRDYETTQEVYASLLKRYEEAQIAESMEQRQKGEQFRVIDPAVASAIPEAPNRPRLLLMGLALSLGLAVAAVVAAENLNAAFHSVDDLRAFAGSVPVLLSIPLIVTPADARRRRRTFQWATGGVVVGVVAIFAVSFFVAHGNEYLVALLARGGRS
jgi:succinoglycan biosynthesis transport protein ExoP